MNAVLCEDVTVTVGRLSARVPGSSFPGSSQDGLGAPGLRCHEKAEKQPTSEANTLKERPMARGVIAFHPAFCPLVPQTLNTFNSEGPRF